MNEKKDLRSFCKGMFCLLPAIILLLIFTVYPIIRTVDMSLYTSYNYFKDIVYANHLSQYLEQNKRISAHIVCFTMEQSLLQFAKEESIALFIINEFALFYLMFFFYYYLFFLFYKKTLL